jgi:murein DD-endopeptidase MepM/ murein hydrolase activator NlpD
MKKGKIEKSKKYISIMLVPHSSKRVRVWKISSLHSKVAAVFAFLFLVIACTSVFISHILNRSRALESINARLYALNLDQKGLLDEKIDEIEKLKHWEDDIIRKEKEFAEKYEELVDNYITSRTDASLASRSGDRQTRSFAADINDLRAILNDLSELNKSGKNQLIDLSETEDRLKRYLDSIPTFWPASGRLSSTYGTRRDPIAGRRRLHEGIDVAASSGDDIRASASGKVTFAGVYNGYGRTVIIDHGNGISTLYGHSSKLLVKEGQTVSKGELIAKVGSSGRSTGPHLHFEIRINGEPVDPLNYLDKK